MEFRSSVVLAPIMVSSLVSDGIVSTFRVLELRASETISSLDSATVSMVGGVVSIASFLLILSGEPT